MCYYCYDTDTDVNTVQEFPRGDSPKARGDSDRCRNMNPRHVLQALLPLQLLSKYKSATCYKLLITPHTTDRRDILKVTSGHEDHTLLVTIRRILPNRNAHRTQDAWTTVSRGDQDDMSTFLTYIEHGQPVLSLMDSQPQPGTHTSHTPKRLNNARCCVMLLTFEANALQNIGSSNTQPQ